MPLLLYDDCLSSVPSWITKYSVVETGTLGVALEEVHSVSPCTWLLCIGSFLPEHTVGFYARKKPLQQSECYGGLRCPYP